MKRITFALRSISTKTFRGLAVAFMLAAMQQLAIAQTEPQAESDSSKLRFVDKIWHWVNTYAMSGPDYLTQERLDFKRSAFAEVYINARIDHPNWLFRMLNRVTEARFVEQQTPNVIFHVALKPDQAVTTYEVKLDIKSSAAIKDLDKIKAAVNTKYFNGKRFPSPTEAEPLIAEAIVETLTQLAATLGNSLAPNLMVRLGDDIYWNGHAINLPESDGNSIELEAIDKNKNPVPPGQLTWTNADAYQSKGVVDMANTNMKQVQLVRRRSSNDTDNLSVIIRRGSGQPDLKEMLKLLIIEALSTKKQEAITSIETLRRDSVANAAEIRRYLAEIEAGNFPMEGDDVLTPMFERPILRPDSTEIFANKDVGQNLKALKRRKQLRSAIRRKLNVVALADLIVDKPDQVKVLLDELLRNSGRLLANLILNTDGDGQRAQARDVVLDFLNNNLERIAAGVYPDALSREPAMTAAAPASQPKTFDPQKYLYVNERMTFTGKDELIRQFTANIPPDTYVFINYSQDVNVASYQARAKGTRPKGLPADAKYKVFTVLHMPGSLLQMNYEDDEESALKKLDEEAFKAEFLSEIGSDNEGTSCFGQGWDRAKQLYDDDYEFGIAAYAGFIKFLVCKTENENCGSGSLSSFSCGITNGLLQELDWVALLEGEGITKKEIAELILCVKDSYPIGGKVEDNPDLYKILFKCITGVELRDLGTAIKDFIFENWDEAYYQGQATAFVVTLLSPYKAKIIEKLRSLPKYASKIAKFESLAKAKNADELVGIAKSLTKGAKTNLLNKLASLDDAKAFVNSLDDVADVGLLNRIDNLSDDQLRGLNEFYKTRQSPAGFSTTDYDFTATKTINGQATSIGYKHGFPEFQNSDFCPSMKYADGSIGKFKFQSDNLDLDNYSSHFDMANNSLLEKMGLSKSSPKNAGFYEKGNYRWDGSSSQFELKNANGEWEKYTWHHYQDGKTLIPVLSKAHTANVGGFVHSGGNSIFKNKIKGIFEFTAY